METEKEFTVEQWMNDARDIGEWRVLAELHESKLSVEFWLYNDAANGPELDVKGYIKWDGCSNWALGETGYQLHFCGMDAVKNFHDAMAEMYKWAKELMGDKCLDYDDIWGHS